MLFTSGDEQGALKRWSKAKSSAHLLRSRHTGNLDIRTGAKLAVNTINILRSYESPKDCAAQKRVLHQTVAAQLYEHIQRSNDFYSLANPTERQVSDANTQAGVIGELVTLGLLTRKAAPYQLCLPALFHHDQGPARAGSFDNLYIESSSDDLPAFYRLQTKSFCIGACDKGRATRHQKSLNHWRARYNGNIRLLGGHCDLDFTRPDEIDADQIRYPYANLIIKEALGKPTADELTTLDMATSGLLRTIKHDETRRGTAGPPMTFAESIAA